jgi:hypothetical protein
MLDLFKQAKFTKTQAVENITSPSADFDQNWTFVNDFVLAENHPDQIVEFKGHLWIKELFLTSQYYSIKVSLLLNITISLILAIEWPAVSYIMDYIEMRQAQQ